MAPFVDFHTHRGAPCADSNEVRIRSYRIGAEDVPAAIAPGTFFTAGIHPWDAATVDIGHNLQLIRRLNPSAIGETGLDYASGVDRNAQRAVFESQLELAAELGKPVIIHCVRALSDVVETITRYPAIDRVALHGFIGSPETVGSLGEMKYYISLGNRAFGSPKTVSALKHACPERLFVETDDDDTASIEDAYRRLSAASGIQLTRLNDLIYNNFKIFFNLA